MRGPLAAITEASGDWRELAEGAFDALVDVLQWLATRGGVER